MSNPFVTDVDQGDNVLHVSEWDDLKQHLMGQGSGYGQEIALTGPNQALMIISCAGPEGYHVIARQSDELGELILVDRTRGDQLVTAPIAGLRDTRPRCAFVDQGMMLRAAEEFYRHGSRSSALVWADPRDL